MLRKRLFIFMCLLGVFGLACTRASKDESSKISIALPRSLNSNKVSSLGLATTLQLAHASINATGAGISNAIVYSWDSCHGCSATATVPDSFQFDIPSGTGRLIQVLAVYQDSVTNQMVFYYGDNVVDLNSSIVPVDIPIFQVGQGNVTSGRVSGRYFTSTTGGPTGLIDIKYNPGNGKPSLIVDRGSIVNGWFSLFMLSGANLQYIVRDTGETLWGQDMSLDATPMNPAENSGAYFDQRVRAYIPVHIRVSNNNNIVQYTSEESQSFVWGYWGPGAVGKKVCTSGLDASPVPQKLKQYVASNLSTAPSFSLTHLTSAATLPPTQADLINTTTPFGSIVVQGGADMKTSCGNFADTAANQYLNFQKVSLGLFDGNGGDSVAGFKGIFKISGMNGFAMVSSDDPKIITGEILPGVEAVFNGLRLFKRLGPDDMYIDTPNCLDIAGGAMNFVPGSSSDAALSSAGSFSLSSNISAAEGTNGVSAVLCPLKDGVLSPLGSFLGRWNFSNFSGGGSFQATQIAIVTPQNSSSTGTIGNNVCTPITIEGRNATGTPAYLPMNTSFTITTNDANTLIYANDSTCSSTPGVTVQGYGSSTVLYVNRSVPGVNAPTTQTFSVTANNALGSASAILTYVDPPATIVPKIKVVAPASIAAYECYPVRYESWHNDGTTSMIVSFFSTLSSSFSFNLPTTPGLNFYYNGDCQNTTMTSGNLGTNVISQLYFSYTGSGTTLNIQPTTISPASPIIIPNDILGGMNLPVSQPGIASSLDFMLPPSFEEGQCQMIKVRMTDANGMTAPAPVATNIDLTSMGITGTFYLYSGCTSPTTSLSLPAASTYQSVYYKATATGSGSLSATSSNLTPAISATRSVTVDPATYSQILIALPGQSFTPGVGISGGAQSLPQGISAQVNIYLVKYDNTIDLNANGIQLSNATASGGSIPAANTISFTSGQAMFSAVPSVSTNINISLGAQRTFGPIYGYANTTTYAAATQLNMYMSNQAALAPGGCQIFAVIPETMDGAAPVLTSVSYSIAADTGAQIYTDANCSIAASGSYMFSSSDRIAAFYFRQPTASTNTVISITTGSGLITSPLNVSTNATALSSAYEFMFTGRFTAMKASVCQPYLVSVADASGRSTVIGADQAVTLQVASGGGTVGTFDDQTCDWPYSGAPTSIPASSNFSTVFLTAMISGSTHILQAIGTPLVSGIVGGIVPSP
jgi:hypothetical protein